VNSLDDIATLYTPGVAFSVQEIIARPEALHELSIKDNAIGVVTDGTAVLGLGRAGPKKPFKPSGSLPVVIGTLT
jgi:malate dehydrogenase (oxaloacetate-decarboxylating)